MSIDGSLRVGMPPPSGGHAGALAAVRAEPGRLLQLRWLSVAAMLAIALLAFPLLVPAHPRQPLLGTALLLAALNLGLMASGGHRAVGRWPVLAQLLVDLLAWGAFLFFAGGVTNPAISLLLPVVAVGAAVLPARQAWCVAAVAIVIYSLLWRFHHPVRIADAELALYWHLAGMWISFAFSAVMVVWFIVRLNAELSLRECALAEAEAARARDAYVVGLGNLAAGAAHRLGTPLGTLRILADELSRRPDLHDDVREDLQLMGGQVDLCRDILNSLTREAGQQRAEGGGPVNVAQWVQSVAARWQQMRPAARLQLSLAPELGERVLVADASLGEAVHNLIDNAANANATATARGSVPNAAVDLCVRLDPATGPDAVLLDVADRGPGIDPALLAAARHAPVGAHAGGMGVGLMLAHAAIELHGGRLDFLSRAGGGTIARLVLPLRAPAA